MYDSVISTIIFPQMNTVDSGLSCFSLLLLHYYVFGTFFWFCYVVHVELTNGQNDNFWFMIKIRVLWPFYDTLNFKISVSQNIQLSNNKMCESDFISAYVKANKMWKCCCQNTQYFLNKMRHKNCVIPFHIMMLVATYLWTNKISIFQILIFRTTSATKS